jgi:hypothetical protein
LKDIALISILIKYKAKYGNVYFVELPVNNKSVLYIARPPSVNEIENWQDTVDNLDLNDVAASSVVGYMCFEAAYERKKPQNGSEYYAKIGDPYFDDSIAYDLGVTVLEQTPITFDDINKALDEETKLSAAGMIAYDVATLTGQPVNDLKDMSTEVLLKLYNFIIKSTGQESIFERLQLTGNKPPKQPEQQGGEPKFTQEDLTENFEKVQEEFNKFLRGENNDGQDD